MIVKSWFKFSLWNNWYKPSNVKFNLDREAGIRNILIPPSSTSSSSFLPFLGSRSSLNLILFKSNLFISLSHASRAISLGMVLINFKSLPHAQRACGPYNFVSIIYNARPPQRPTMWGSPAPTPDPQRGRGVSGSGGLSRGVGHPARDYAGRRPPHYVGVVESVRSTTPPHTKFDSFSSLINQFWFNSSSCANSSRFYLVINSQQLHINPNIKTFIPFVNP